MIITQIIKGHVNELFGKEQQLHDMRMEICKQCPLYKVGTFGPICDSSKFLNPLTGVVNYSGGKGFFQGCACRLEAKTRIEDAKCPAGKW